MKLIRQILFFLFGLTGFLLVACDDQPLTYQENYDLELVFNIDSATAPGNDILWIDDTVEINIDSVLGEYDLEREDIQFMRVGGISTTIGEPVEANFKFLNDLTIRIANPDDISDSVTVAKVSGLNTEERDFKMNIFPDLDLKKYLMYEHLRIIGVGTTNKETEYEISTIVNISLVIGVPIEGSKPE